MDLSGVISISGRPGLYKVVAQGKNSIIVESLIDNKRFPAYSTDRISALEDISIYTYEGDKPLKNILEDIYKKQDGKASPSHKEDISTLQEFLSDILPDYDEERVYPSDIKKLFQWYNILLKAGVLEAEPEAEETEAKEESPKEKTADKPKKAPAKKATPKKADADKPKKKPAAKKPAAKSAAKKSPAKSTATKKSTKKD